MEKRAVCQREARAKKLRFMQRRTFADERIMPFNEGDVVRFEDNDLHGFVNSGTGEFEYLSVTSRPINFRSAYAKKWK